jgi:O-antigen ligase
MTLTQVLLVAAVPVGAAVAVICLREPLRVALPLFASLVPFGGALSVVASPFGSLSSLAGMLLGAGLLLRFMVGGRTVMRLSAAPGVWLLFLGVVTATTLWSIDRPVTLRGLAVLASLVGVYVLVAVSRVDRVVVRRTENGLVVGATAAVCYGLFQLVVLGGFPSDRPGAGITAEGRFGNDLIGPNVLAVSLLLPMVITLSRAVREAGRWRTTGNLMLSGLMLLGVLMTGSRTGALAVGVVLLVLASTSPREGRRPILISTAVAGTVVAFVWIFHPAGIAERTFETAASPSGRTDIWEVGFTACSTYCATGSGWGTYPQVYAETQAAVPGARVLSGDKGAYQPHNLWLLAVVEAGIAGLLLLGWGFGLAILDALRLPRDLRGPPLSAVTGLVFAVFFLSSMEFKFFWMMLMMIALYRNLADDHPPTAQGAVPARSSHP